MSEDQPQPVQLCSYNSHCPAFATFINRTSRDLSLEWLNFRGDHVVYERNMHPGARSQMNTFKGHPWVFYESKCRHPLAVLPDNSRIYFPVEHIDGPPMYHDVHIVTPRLTLQQSCLNFIHRRLFVDCRCDTLEKMSARIDEMVREFGIVRKLGDVLKKMATDQRNFNIPIYVLPSA